MKRPAVRVIDAINKNVQEATKPLPKFVATLGNAAGVVLTDKPGVVYVTFENGQTIEVLNRRIPNRPGMRVLVGYTEDAPGVLQVLSEVGLYGKSDGAPLVPDHGETHAFGGGDTVFISVEQWKNLLVLPYDGFEVQVFGGVFQQGDGTFGVVQNQVIDLAGEVPPEGALYVLLEHDDDGDVVVTSGVCGSTANTKEQLTLADIPAITNRPMCAIRLYADQIEIQRNPNGLNDFVDLRFGMGVAQNTLALDGYAVDLTTTPPTAGQVLIYDACSDTFYPGAQSGGGSWDGDITDIDVSSSADIGAALADADQFIVYDATATAWVRSALSRIWTYISGKFEPTPDYDDISTNDGATDVTGAELEELSDGSDTTLHDHDGISENSAARHTQGTDTALGTQAEALDMGGYQINNLADPTTQTDAVNLKSLINSLGVVLNYWFEASNVMQTIYVGIPAFVTNASSAQGTEVELTSIYWASSLAQTPAPFTIKNGTEFLVHFNAKVSAGHYGASYKTVKVRAKLYHTNAAGADLVQIGATTSDSILNLTEASVLQELYGIVTAEVAVPASRRLLVKVFCFVNVSAAPNYPTIAVEYGDVHDHLSVPLPGSVLGNFLQLAGGTMSGDIVMGGTQQVTGLQAPDTAGDAIRATAKITEVLLESATDLKHTAGTDTALGAVGAKNPPIDADKAIYRDSTASDALVTSTWTQIKAFLKTYFDTLYNKYVHPNHSGDVTSVADGAQTIATSAVTLAKMADVATASILGRNTAGAGAPEVLSKATTLSLLNVEDGAEVNNISDGNATDLTDGGDTTLHDHDGISENTSARHTQGTDTALGALGTKDPPIDADKVLYRDSTASDALVTSTWTQVKAFLKTYFDGLYTGGSTDGWNALAATLTYGSADDPIYVISSDTDLTNVLSVGMRLRFTNDGSTVYGIVHAIGVYGGAPAAQAITMYGGTDYDVANSAITVPYYSPVKAPLGFPGDQDKWTVDLISDTSDVTQASPNASQVYNLGSLSGAAPIGAWNVIYTAYARSLSNAAQTQTGIVTSLSSSASAINVDLAFGANSRMPSGTLAVATVGGKAIGYLLLAAKTTYYITASTPYANQANITLFGTVLTTSVKLICVYL